MTILEVGVSSYSVAHAKEQLSKLIDEAIAGERVTIPRHGKPVVELHSVEAIAPRRPSPQLVDEIGIEAKKIGPLGISPVDLVREMRDEEP